MNAHFAAARYEDYVEAAQRSIQLRPTFYGAHFVSAAALGLLGRIHEAEQAKARVLDANPRLTLRCTDRNPMFTQAVHVSCHFFEGLRRAGLPG